MFGTVLEVQQRFGFAQTTAKYRRQQRDKSYLKNIVVLWLKTKPAFFFDFFVCIIISHNGLGEYSTLIGWRVSNNF